MALLFVCLLHAQETPQEFWVLSVDLVDTEFCMHLGSETIGGRSMSTFICLSFSLCLLNEMEINRDRQYQIISHLLQNTK